MKKTYITPVLKIADLDAHDMIALSYKNNFADNNGENNAGDGDQDGTDGYVKGDHNLWDEEW